MRLFCRLAVFAGGFSLEAAETVANALPRVAATEPISPSSDPRRPSPTSRLILDLLAGLIDKSLLRPLFPDGPHPRFAMLETVREFALEQLDMSGTASAVRAAHADYFLALVEQAAPHLWGHDQLVWLSRLEAEHDNLRTALAWHRGHATGSEPVARLALALSWFWYLHGHIAEGRRWLEDLLAGVPDDSNEPSLPAKARALVGTGLLAYGGGDLAGAAVLLEAGIDVARAAEDLPTLVRALDFLGFTLRDQGHYTRAAVLFDEGLVVAQAIGDRWGIGFSTYLQGTVAHESGDLERATAYFEEQSLPLLREQGERLALGYTLNDIGEVALARHDEARAASVLAESLALSQALGNLRGIGFALLNLGIVARRRGDYAAATAYIVESLAPWRRLGNDRGIAYALEELAHIAAECGDAMRAARLSGAASTLREAIGLPRTHRMQSDHDAAVAPASAALGEEAFTAAWNAGRDVPVDDALAEGRNLAESTQASVGPPNGHPSDAASRL